MDPIAAIQKELALFLQKHFSISTTDAKRFSQLTLLIDEHKQHFGDLSCNCALSMTKLTGIPPQKSAITIAEKFKHPFVEKILPAGPGFLNITLTHAAFPELLKTLYKKGRAFFQPDQDEVPPKKISLEFVSANPTGPLHLGHGRGGIIGDVLASLMKFCGHDVTKEFYINDAGAQIEKLGLSLKVRCQQVLGMESSLPEDAYHGDYLVGLAQQCINEYGAPVLTYEHSFFQKYATEQLLSHIKKTLTSYGITFDVWFSEKSLHEKNAIEKTLEVLKKKNLLYEKNGALWFKATDYGDDKDRVMKKSSEAYTYVAADSAYLRNKVARGFDILIMVLGADHHGYTQRLQGLLSALTSRQVQLIPILYQLVKLKEGTQRVRMSKRAGTMLTLHDVIDTVGTDVARFFYLNKKADAQLELDIDLALKKSSDNPLYYIQYAYVRAKSILENAHSTELLKDYAQDNMHHLHQSEAFLIKKLYTLKGLIVDISINYQTHLLAHYAYELAALFHRYYAHHKIIDLDNLPASKSRLLLVNVFHETLASVLDLLKINKPDRM